MLTFEDFFAKKKIDLKALENDDKELYQEFYEHYYAMGEKSFDHTKKFWFNRLRKSYRLDEPEISVPKEKPQEKETAKTISAPGLGFRPKFKAKTAEPKSDVMEPDPQDTVTDNKPSGFKPRFKAGVTKAASSEPAVPSSGDDVSEESTSDVGSSKPSGFKPRFKAGVTKAASSEPAVSSSGDDVSEESTSDVGSSKPSGFKPRFKAGVTKAKSKDDIDNAD